MNKKIINWLLLFLGFFLLLQIINPPKPSETVAAPAPVEVYLNQKKTSLKLGDSVLVDIKNNTATPLSINSQCPYPPLTIIKNGQALAPESALCDQKSVTVESGSVVALPLDNWYEKAFTDNAAYQVAVNYTSSGQTLSATGSFLIEERGWFANGFNMFIFKPIYNGLILATKIIPGNNLGWAIILLTIIIRLILLIPNQKALESQKEMQVLQPKIKAIQEKYKGDQTKISEETMKLWKEHKINPFGSCLPMLIQFPILIALYWAVQIGITIPGIYYVYEPLQAFVRNLIESGEIHRINSFFGLDLMATNVYYLAIIIGALQWYQMKLSFDNKAKKEEGKKTKELVKKTEDNPLPNFNNNKVMLYVFPLLIAFLSISFPAGVGLYWGFSTLFGIGQQLYVNHKDGSPKNVS